MNKKWYAVYTKPRWEKKVSDLLNKKSVENYCPLNRVVRQWADRKKTIFEPLFNSYVFVHASEEEQVAIRKTDGVLSFVHWLGKPAVIRNAEIDTLKRFLRTHNEVKLEKIQVNINDHVIVSNGPLMLMEGQVVEVRNRTIKVFLPSLGYAMIAEVKMTDVEVLHQPSVATIPLSRKTQEV